VIGPHREQRRIAALAGFEYIRAAWREVAASRQASQVGHHPLDGRQPAAAASLRIPARDRHRAQQAELLQELHHDVSQATVVYCDNVSAVYLSANPVHHRRTKHIELDIHFVREQVALGRIRVLHVPNAQQFADVMTKGLPTSTFEEFRSSLCVSGDASTAGGC
jgi:hypothetical protein